MLVPTINGYKRLVGGEAFWAPNAVTYGYDSRAASIRIISPPGVEAAATRFEVRIPGADMNPYFALSAIFLLGLRGIEKKMKLTIPPVSHFSPEDRKTGKVKMLPVSLDTATQRMMRADSIARDPDVFGNVFVDHFGGTREHEVGLWNEAVTNWEGTNMVNLWLLAVADATALQSRDISNLPELKAKDTGCRQPVIPICTNLYKPARLPFSFEYSRSCVLHAASNASMHKVFDEIRI